MALHPGATLSAFSPSSQSVSQSVSEAVSQGQLCPHSVRQIEPNEADEWTNCLQKRQGRITRKQLEECSKAHRCMPVRNRSVAPGERPGVPSLSAEGEP